MPDLTSIAATLRRGGFNYTGYLATIPRTVVLQGTISANPTYPAKQLSYTLTAGDEGDVTQDMTVDLFSSGGDFKATLRVASGQTVTSSVLPLNEWSRGLYEATIGDTFKVYAEYRIWDRLVSASAALNKDSRITYTDQLANPVPVCNSGGPYAGFGTSVSFAGSTSFTIDPDSSGSLTHAWNFVDGTPSTSSSANPSDIVFPVGFRYVSHTVTDASNSKSTTQYIPVWVFDKTTYAPLRVQMDNLSDRTENGVQVSFKLPYGTEGDINNLPDGALVVYFEREYRQGAEGSYGSNVANRSHVKFCGYLIRDSISIDADGSEVAFEAVNALGILEQTPALPQLMVSKSAPTKWSQVRGLSTKEIFWYISYWGASLQTAWDFVWTDGIDLDYARIAVEGQTIAEQLRDIANGLNIQCTCDPLGRIQFIRDPSFLNIAERAGRTTAYDFTTADVISVEITREHRGTTKMVRGEGITPTNKAIFSNAPGNAPASLGVSSDTLAKQIVENQAGLNSRTMLLWARLNGIFNGKPVPKGVRLTVPDGYDIFSSADREFVTLTLPADTNTRGISFADTERWTIESREVSYDIEAGAKNIVYTLDHETFADYSDENTYIPPQETDNGVPASIDLPPLDVSFPEITTDTGTGIGSGGGVVAASGKKFAAFSTDNHLYITEDFDTPAASGGPTWGTDVDLTALANWGGGDLIAFEADPYSPAYVGTASTAVNGWIVTTTHIQKILDIFGAVALNTATALHDTSSKRVLAVSRKTKNFVIVATWYDTEGVFAAVTTDGSTWTEAVVTTDYLTTGGDFAPGVFISDSTAGKAYIAVWTATDDPMAPSDATASLYKTTNYGAAWSLLASPTIDSGDTVSSSVVVPLKNKSNTVIYYRKHSAADGVQLMRHFAGVDTDITPVSAGFGYISAGTYAKEIAMPDQDDNVLVAIGFAGSAIAFDIWEGQGANLVRGFDPVQGAYVQVDAIFNGPLFGGYVAAITSNNPDICAILKGTDDTGITGGEFFYDLCGESVTVLGEEAHHRGLAPSGLVNTVGHDSTTAFTMTFYLSPSDVSGIPYGVLLTKDAKADAPTWTSLDISTTEVYTEVYALSSKRFIVLGENGYIGLANDTSLDNRRGNLSTTGRLVGVAGSG